MVLLHQGRMEWNKHHKRDKQQKVSLFYPSVKECSDWQFEDDADYYKCVGVHLEHCLIQPCFGDVRFLRLFPCLITK